MLKVPVNTTRLGAPEGKPGHVVSLPGAGPDEAEMLKFLNNSSKLGLLELVRRLLVGLLVLPGPGGDGVPAEQPVVQVDQLLALQVEFVANTDVREG